MPTFNLCDVDANQTEASLASVLRGMGIAVEKIIIDGETAVVHYQTPTSRVARTNSVVYESGKTYKISVREPMQTGIKAVDSLVPIGR